MFVRAYIQTAIEILITYKGNEPFHFFIKKYFSEHKKFGSRDRRYITQLCYHFFRLGKALTNVDSEERLMIALFFCSQSHNPVLQKIKPEWNEVVDQNINYKINLVKERYSFSLADIFPFAEEVSASVDFEAFVQSFFIQPDVFLRIRPGKESSVKNKLAAKNVEFNTINNSCISLRPGEKVDDVVLLNKEVVVQDYSSQQVLAPLNNFLKNHQFSIQSAWDCCAASGGKSILLKDNYPSVQITATDIRESIIVNLRKRFREADIKNFRSFTADVTDPDFSFDENFDLIICDAPCSGSGTWGRTPEQLYFFDVKRIDDYSNLQQKIVRNATRFLKDQGLFLYITCSVFNKENEVVVNVIQKELGLRLIEMQYFTGYHHKADTLFAALFAKA